jgi:hypothetical protein
MTPPDDGGEDSNDAGGRVIDPEGRLFGIVNIVDALVVLLVIAVVSRGLSYCYLAAAANPIVGS